MGPGVAVGAGVGVAVGAGVGVAVGAGVGVGVGVGVGYGVGFAPAEAYKLVDSAVPLVSVITTISLYLSP